MTDRTYSASSCAVENGPDGIRLTLDFMNFAEYHAAEHTLNKPDVFVFDMRPPENGGCSGGSKLVLIVQGAFGKAASDALDSFRFRRGVQYVNGSRTPCATVAEAIDMVLDHS